MRTVNVRINYLNGGHEIRSMRTAANVTPEGISRTVMSGGSTRIRSVEIVPATVRLSVRPDHALSVTGPNVVRSYLD